MRSSWSEPQAAQHLGVFEKSLHCQVSFILETPPILESYSIMMHLKKKVKVFRINRKMIRMFLIKSR